MNRYIIHKDSLKYIDIQGKDAVSELKKDIIIENDTLIYKNIPYVSIILNEEQVKILKNNNVSCEIEKNNEGKLFATYYQKIDSSYIKSVKKLINGKGCKVAIMDSGLNVTYVPVDYAVNFADANPGVGGNPSHGTQVTSILKSSIGIANGSEVHFLKVLTDDDEFNESALLAAIDYCIDNNIDIVNMSFSYSSTSFDNAISELISNDCVVVAATGNNTSNDVDISKPAALNNVVAVNSISENGTFYHRNVNIPSGGSHGVTLACSGVGCETINSSGNMSTNWGTSFSCIFFVGVFACYKEELNNMNNYELLEYILSKCIKNNNSLYFGLGIPTF